MKYEIVMGLEVHVELSTKTKLFCACPAAFGGGPNEHTCPACVGMPGMPPLINKNAIELAARAAILTNGEITRAMAFDKKNYFYPDLPTGFQITQYFTPISKGGWVEINTGGGDKKITLHQIHLEEDAGKLVHDGRAASSLIDYNRAGVPLIEIVSNPDFRTSEEVVAYLEKLRSLLSYANISDCKMQEGSMRCDINISVREHGAKEMGTRVEIKNMNSLKAISAAIEYESNRQIEALETGGEAIVQETRRWDDNKSETFSMREKADAVDYRYFPNPEILPVYLNEEWITEIKNNIPESAETKYMRMTTQLGLSDYDSGILTASRNLSRIFDEVMACYNSPKEIANWIIVDLLSTAKGNNKGEDDIAIDCKKFAALIELVDKKTINRGVGKELLIKVLEDEIDPAAYVKENNLEVVSDTGIIEEAARETLAENEKTVIEYRNGSKKVLGFLVGKVMKKLSGKADPRIVNEVLTNMLE